MSSNKLDLDFIANELDKIKIEKDGKVFFDMFQALEYEVLLNTAIDMPEIPNIEKKRIIHKAILSLNDKKKITISSINIRINELKKEFLDKPIRQYVILTEISIHWSLNIHSIRVEDAYFNFKPHLKRKFYSERNDLIENAHSQMKSEFPKDYRLIKILVNARTEEAAFDKAMDNFDLIRGILNYSINKSGYRRITHGGRQPINSIVLGPVHTCHSLSGSIEKKVWWYETNYQGPMKVYNKSDKIKRALEDFNKIRHQIKKSIFKNKLEEAIKRYGRALDIKDWQVSFIKLWGVLELLAGAKDVNHFIKISRVASLYPNNELHQQILLNLKEYRNASVHADMESSDSEILETQLFQLKSYVELLIRFVLNNDQHFNSIDEFWKFMDLLRQSDKIDEKMRLLKNAKFYIT